MKGKHVMYLYIMYITPQTVDCFYIRICILSIVILFLLKHYIINILIVLLLNHSFRCKTKLLCYTSRRSIFFLISYKMNNLSMQCS